MGYWYILHHNHRLDWRYLHYADNTTLPKPGEDGYERLGKIKPLVQYLQQHVYHPGRNIAVDEAMLKFQGRSALKQYMPKKPIKRGIKVWVLGDRSNGYFSCRRGRRATQLSTILEGNTRFFQLSIN